MSWFVRRNDQRRLWPAAAAGTVALVFLLVAGCMTIEQMAPPVDQAFTASPAAADLDPQQLARGRQIYLGACAACHAPEPIADYSADQWQEIMPEMARLSKLGPPETEAVTAYVLAAQAYLEQSGQ